MAARIYLDNQATTRLDPRVLQAMLPWMSEEYGNAASRLHSFGWEAEKGVDRAREQLAEALGANKREILFTSGATESNNLALLGVARHPAVRGRHLITAASEHLAVLDPMRQLEREGFELTVLPVDDQGRLSVADFERALRPDTALVSLMHANNEVGTIHPIAELARICTDRGVILHCDAAQSVGKEAIDLREMPVDLLSFTAHKFHGPKGCGALYLRGGQKRTPLQPLIHGGGHERGLRSGTLNVPAIIGMGLALELARQEHRERREFVRSLRDRLEHGLRTRIERLQVNGAPEARLAGNLNLSIDFVDGQKLLNEMEGVAASTGSACTSATPGASHVLRAMGRDALTAQASIRFSLSHFNTEAEIEDVVERVAAAVVRLRERSPRYQTWVASQGRGSM